MLLVPAIDLKEGQCVRLRQGRMDDATVFSDDPVATALDWQARGARRLHLVDLDGAFEGRPVNAEAARAVVRALDIPVQLGGGIRDRAVLDAYLDAGLEGLILGTAAVRDPAFARAAIAAAPGRIWIGIDARGGRVAVSGWDDTTDEDATTLARRFAEAGAAGVVYTDIERDGMMQGVNVEATVAMARAVDVPVIASGGIASLVDLESLARGAAGAGVALFGAISGRALYEGRLDFAAGQALLDGATG